VFFTAKICKTQIDKLNMMLFDELFDNGGHSLLPKGIPKFNGLF
jgi:hypothetical protein